MNTNYQVTRETNCSNDIFTIQENITSQRTGMKILRMLVAITTSNAKDAYRGRKITVFRQDNGRTVKIFIVDPETAHQLIITYKLTRKEA